MKCKAVIFDMDDTLFLEKDYVLSGFREVCFFLNSKFGIDANESYNFLKKRFIKHGRNKIFNNLLSKYDEELQGVDINKLIEQLVDTYRKHEPDIDLNPMVKNVLTNIRQRNIKIVIATDGLSIMQENKYLALGLDKFVDNIVYCWSHDAAKPSKKCFKIAAKMIGIDLKDCIIVGDHPEHDIVPARMLGAKTYRIRTGRFSNLKDDHNYPPHQSFLNLDDFFQRVINI
jgi:putative hydrolase of the HAD superfamily